MAPFIDPFEGSRRGLESLNNSLANINQMDRQQKMDAVNLRQLALQEQEQKARLGTLQAEQGAMQDAYGGTDLRSAYAAKMKAELQAKKVTDFFSQMKTLKDSGASPQFRTEYAKKQLAKVPEYAELAPSISYIDDEAIKIVKEIGPNQIPGNTATYFIICVRSRYGDCLRYVVAIE